MRDHDHGDGLLARYESCWWFNFNEGSDLNMFRQDPIDIIKAWIKQKKTMPAPVPIPPSDMVNLQELTQEEASRAYDVALDMVAMLDNEIQDNGKCIGDVSVMIVKTRAKLWDIWDLRENARRASTEEVMVRAATEGSRGKGWGGELSGRS
jgi:hypothetical protein